MQEIELSHELWKNMMDGAPITNRETLNPGIIAINRFLPKTTSKNMILHGSNYILGEKQNRNIRKGRSN